MVRTQIQLTERQMAALKSKAVREGLSMAELIRKGVDLVLAVPEIPDPQERRQRALKAAGRFHSGLGDLSINHDRYFVEAQEKQ